MRISLETWILWTSYIFTLLFHIFWYICFAKVIGLHHNHWTLGSNAAWSHLPYLHRKQFFMASEYCLLSSAASLHHISFCCQGFLIPAVTLQMEKVVSGSITSASATLEAMLWFKLWTVSFAFDTCVSLLAVFPFLKGAPQNIQPCILFLKIAECLAMLSFQPIVTATIRFCISVDCDPKILYACVDQSNMPPLTLLYDSWSCKHFSL